jgi:predicted amidohydrolase YtcJ
MLNRVSFGVVLLAVACAGGLSGACGGEQPSPRAAAPASAAAPVASAPRAPAASGRVRVFHHGDVYTAVAGAPHAQAMAIAGAKILKVGTNEAVLAAYPDADRVDVHGKTIIPGLNDAHQHDIPDPAGAVLEFKSMEPTLAEVRAAVAAEAAKKNGKWILGDVGIAILADLTVNRAFLDSIAPDNPVFLRAYYGHGHILNSKALDALKIKDSVVDPQGGRFGRTKDGKLDGRAYEYAEWITGRALAAQASDDDIAAGQQRTFGQALHFGITSIQTMSWSPADRYLRAAQSSVQHGPRLRWINWPANRAEAILPAERRSDKLTISGVKWMLDGTPFEREAAVSTPYLDSKTTGKPKFSQDEVTALFAQAAKDKQQPLVHAVGDVAIGEALNAAARMSPADRAALRPRIEHGDWLRAEDDARAIELSCVVVANPTHFGVVELLMKRFGPARRSMRLASMIRSGVHVAIGSDGPLNPFLNIMLATIHPYRPEEAITREQAIDAYTREAAYAEHAEAEKGTLEAGKLADFAILSAPVFSVPTEALPGTFSVLTVIGGEVMGGAEKDL